MFYLENIFFIKSLIKYVCYQVCLGKLTFIESFVILKTLFQSFSQERLFLSRNDSQRRQQGSCPPGLGAVFDHWHCLELLVHDDNKKQTGFWSISLSFLGSLQTMPLLTTYL